MIRRLFISIPLVLAAWAWADEPAPPSPPSQAPVAPPGAVGLLIANSSSGLTTLEKRALQGLFRGMMPQVPAGHRVLIYMLPPGNTAQNDVFEKTVGWSESTFERQSAIVESTLGRTLFKRMPGSSEVLAAVVADPGGIGIVAADTLLTPGVVVLWPAASP